MNTAIQITQKLNLLGKKLFALAVIAALFAPLTWSLPAHAMTFEQAAKKGTARIGELDEMRGFLAKATSKALGKVTLSNIQADGKGLTGEVNLRGKPWTIVINAGDGEKKSFVGFGPKTGFTFGDLIGNNPMAKLFDTMKLTRPILFISAADVSMGSDDLPASIKTYLGPLYENPGSFTLDLTQGLSLISALDMSKATILDKAIKFLGGKSSKVQLKGEMDVAVIDSMINVLGAPPGPNLKLSAALPTFRPTIGGKITMPANVQFTYRVNFFKGGKWLGLDGVSKFKIGRQMVDVKLAQTFHLPATGVAYSKTKISIFEDKPWKNAFGLKWLTVKGYNMLFKLKSDASMYVEFGGSTIFGSKTINLAGGAGISAKSGGLPIPSLLDFSVDDGPDKVGTLALRDMLSVYNEMAKSTGNKALVDLDKVPDVAISGTGKGKENAPHIKLLFEGSGDDGFDISGNLRILGTNVAVVEKAFLKTNSGVEIRAHTAKLKAGPIGLPNAAVEIVVLLDRDSGKAPKPRVLVHSEALSLFGSKQELDLKLFIDKAFLASKLEAGDLFKFNFRAWAGFTQPLTTLKELASADFRLAASLSSDPGAWIRNIGRQNVKKEFDKLTPGFDAARKAVDDAKREVDRLSTEIRRQRAKVKRERQSATDAIKGAEDEVNRLQGQINHFEGRRVYFNSRIKPANQTLNVCVLYSLRRSGCHKKVWGHCVVPRYSQYCASRKNLPNYPARAWTEARNLEWRSQSIWADGKKHAVIAAKFPAVATLKALRAGINKLPTDLDPRVAGLIASKETAKLALDLAKEGIKGISAFRGILTKALNAFTAPSIFVLEQGLIKGSLTQSNKGDPVILDLTFKVHKKRFKNRLAFWFGNEVETAKQFSLVALGIAVKEVVKLGKASKIVPGALLDKVENLYFGKKHAADAILAKAIKANGNISTDPADAKLRLSRSLELDQTVRRVKREAAHKRKIALRKKFGDLLSKKRLEQLDKLTKGNKWKRMPGAALDIGAGKNGSVWIIGQDKSIWSWTGSNWKKQIGAAKRIDVGPQGRAWIIGTNNAIYRWNGKGWDNPGAGYGLDIGVGADGTAWAIGTDSGIYRSNGTAWVKMPGGAKRIDVDPNGHAWVVNYSADIYRWNPGKKNWDRMPGKALDIGIGADGTVIIVGGDVSPYVWDGKKWNPMPGGISHITVDKDGNPWAVNSSKQIWAWDNAAKARAARITLTPWKPYGSGYGKALASKEGDIVTVTGLVKHGDYNTPLMTLPKGMRPSGRLIFNVDNHGAPVRMDVMPDGRIMWTAGAKAHGWLSLSGITFNVKKGRPLPLVNGWKNYGGGYAPATVSKSGDIVTVSGLIKGNYWGHVATLPKGMRPPRYSVFNVNNHGKSTRVNVTKDGAVIWQAGGKDYGWISLSGISFSVKPDIGLPLANSWENMGGVHAPATVSRQGDLVTVSGLIKNGGWGLLGNLPFGFRPPDRMVFSTNNHANSARVDVLENGRIEWMTGGKQHAWLSLDGIRFQTDDPPIVDKWKKMPGKALDIAAGANGSVWLIGQDKSIWSWTGSNWKKRSGCATSIDIGPRGRPWVTGCDTAIRLWNGTGWDKIPGYALDIGVGADGSVWYVGTDRAPYKKVGHSWPKMPGGNLLAIDVDKYGNAWSVNVHGEIFRWTGTNWVKLPGLLARDIGIGPNGEVWIVGANGSPYVWNGAEWDYRPGSIKRITVDKDGNPWAINAGKDIHAWDKAGKAKVARVNPEFDPDWYLNHHADLKRAFGNDHAKATKHWNDAKKEGRQTSATFSIKAYVNRHPDLMKSFGTDYVKAWDHWYKWGKKEGRNPMP